ncbi:MAG: formylglycine-generating enzyme family protein [Myxococcota bacterium]
MAEVPDGVFRMGSTEREFEQPIRVVNIDAYFIDITEVTVEQYQECPIHVCDPPYCALSPSESNWEWNDRFDHPVNCVTWEMARAYCGWVDGATKRLPTEAEWEKAARGTDAYRYPWGDVPEPNCTLAVMNDGAEGCGEESTSPAGSKPDGMSPYGVLDIAGNLSEWVWDLAGDYDPQETDNPTGPASGSDRIVRGGSWQSGASDLRTTKREVWNLQGSGFKDIGFRCVRPAPE